MRYLVFDVESISASNPAVRSNRVDINDQDLTLLAVYDSESGAYSTYLKPELPKLWPLIERADLLVGYNSNQFDIPLLNRYYPGDLSKIPSLDLLSEVYKALGRRLRLGTLALATLGRGKSGTGTKAQDWWQEGEIEKVREYCLEDVRLTKELYDHARAKGSLKYKDLGKLREIKIDASDWGKEVKAPALTHTLSL